MTTKEKKLVDAVVNAAESGDRARRWKAVYDLLRFTNKKARKEQDEVAADCALMRSKGIFKKTKSKKMGLRFGVSIPPMTWNALVEADRLAYGRSDLFNTDKEDYKTKDGSNVIVKDLEKAFPQYRVS